MKDTHGWSPRARRVLGGATAMAIAVVVGAASSAAADSTIVALEAGVMAPVASGS